MTVREDINIHTFKHTHSHTQTTGGRRGMKEERKGGKRKMRKERKDDRKRRERR